MAGVAAPLGSWNNWPRHLLDPHFNSVLEDTSSDQNSSPTLKSTFSEKDGIYSYNCMLMVTQLQLHIGIHELSNHQLICPKLACESERGSIA